MLEHTDIRSTTTRSDPFLRSRPDDTRNAVWRSVPHTAVDSDVNSLTLCCESISSLHIPLQNGHDGERSRLSTVADGVRPRSRTRYRPLCGILVLETHSGEREF